MVAVHCCGVGGEKGYHARTGERTEKSSREKSDCVERSDEEDAGRDAEEEDAGKTVAVRCSDRRDCSDRRCDCSAEFRD